VLSERCSVKIIKVGVKDVVLKIVDWTDLD
jgi:hypothetical protein